MPERARIRESNCTHASKTAKTAERTPGVPQRHLGVGRNRLARRIRAYTETTPARAIGPGSLRLIGSPRTGVESPLFRTPGGGRELRARFSTNAPALQASAGCSRQNSVAYVSDQISQAIGVQARRIRTTPSAIAQAHLESGSCLGRVSKVYSSKRTICLGSAIDTHPDCQFAHEVTQLQHNWTENVA